MLKLIASTKTILAFVISFILGAPLISAYESVHIDFNTDFSQEEMNVIKNNISYNNIDRNIDINDIKRVVFSLKNWHPMKCVK